MGLALVLLLGLGAFGGIAYYFLGALGGGSVKIESEPEGASVMLNGKLAGATPVVVKGLSSGIYSLRLEKSGYAPSNVQVTVSSAAANSIKQKLEPLALGTLVCNIKPDDAEVLIDGELAGHTPLKLDTVEVGPHEMLVRKTNFSSYSRRIDIEAGHEVKFEDLELADRVLELLENQVKAEPQRVAHYIDLAHYYFVNDRMDDSVEMFLRAQEVINEPLDFNGPGYPGRDKLSPEEIEVEQRLRREDASRYPKELEKHRSFPRKDVRAFRMKLMEAMDGNAKRNVKSWISTNAAAQDQIKNQNYDRAAKIYKEHIAAVPLSPDLPKAYLALIEVDCMQADVNAVSADFDKFFALYGKKDGPSLRQCGNIVNQYLERPRAKTDRDRLMKISEKTLRAGLELPCDQANKAQALFDLGMCLYYQERVADAVPVLRQSVDLTQAMGTQEDRQLRLAEALRKSGDKNGATELYTKLKGSERPNVRETANYGLIAIKQAESKQ